MIGVRGGHEKEVPSSQFNRTDFRVQHSILYPQFLLAWMVLNEFVALFQVKYVLIDEKLLIPKT